MIKKSFSTGNRNRQAQKQRFNMLMAGLAISGIAFTGLLIWFQTGIREDAAAAPGKDGAITVTTTNRIVNEFTTLTSNASSGSTQLTVASNNLNTNNRFSGPLAAGDLVMIIQMQGASISTTNGSAYGSISAYNNAGKYELADVSGVSGSNKINLVYGLKNNYSSSGRVQVIRVPRISNLVVNAGASLTTPAWNGTTGGVLALEVNGPAVIHGSMDVSGKGFRGGTVDQNSSFPGNHATWRSTNTNDGAEKGESIAGSTSVYDGLSGRYGRGAPANGGGGGNSHNASGGGGANGGNTASWNGKGNPDLTGGSWSTCWNLEGGSFGGSSSSGGGRGGYSYSANAENPVTKAPGDGSWGGDNRYNVGGYGGRPLDYSGGRIFMGGGGGAGDSNDGTGTSGANGGGIVVIACGSTVSGTGAVYANGASAGTTTAPQGWDGSGGGGGGGTIIIYTRGGAVSDLTIQANGGAGGSQHLIGDPEAEGAGGGGGGGYVSITASVSLSISVANGSMGSTNSSTMVAFTPNGGTHGGTGTITSPPANPYSSLTTLPVKLVFFNATSEEGYVLLTWETASEKNNDHFTIDRSVDGDPFVPIGKIQGSGNASSASRYSMEDRNLVPGTLYYRLSQTDIDGKTEIFCIVSVKNGSKTVNTTPADEWVKAGPNPFSGSFKVSIRTGLEGMATVELLGMNGNRIRKENVELSNGSAEYVFQEESRLQRGIYFLRITAPDQSEKTIKLVRQ